MLEDPEAFHPRARVRAAAAAVGGRGEDGERALLPAALAADSMLSSLLLWATHLPPFAAHLIGPPPAAQALLRGSQEHESPSCPCAYNSTVPSGTVSLAEAGGPC